MSGDLFHYGHARFLKKIKDNNPGCISVIGLISDEQMIKYKRKPVMNFEERKEVLLSCRYVDEVISCPLTYTYEVLDSFQIDKVIHAHLPSEDEKYHYFCREIPDKFERYSYTPSISTTQIIERISNTRNQK
jgi:cytidyltransferase-related domain